MRCGCSRQASPCRRPPRSPADVFTLAVGDCFNDEGQEDEVSEVPIVDCAQPHDNEIFHVFDLEDGDYPGDDAIFDAAIAQCDAAFETFAGVPYEESALDWDPFYPTEESWEQADDREVACYIYDPDSQVTGTLEGAAY